MPEKTSHARLEGGGRPAGEQRLVESARAGDEQSFAALVERYGQPVLSLCYGSTLNPADAEELAQEVFLAAWRGLARFRGEASFSTWLFAIARNACIDRARQTAARPRLLASDDELASASPQEPVETTAAAIVRAAAELPVALRQALLLRDVQGLSYEEIAGLQEVPIGTVRSRIAAARAAVAKAVQE